MASQSNLTFSGTHNQGAQIGINSGTVNNHFNSRADRSSTPPKPSSNVPFSRDNDFVDRGDILARVDERCSQPAGRVALVGFGGFGKSQLAIEYAHRARRRSPDTWIFWVYASNSARLEEAFSDIPERVGLHIQPGSTADTVLVVYKWLCNEANGRWLMIIDSVDDEIMVKSQKDGQSISLASLLPQCDHGAIVVTSRNADVARSLVGRQQDIITIGSMTEDEAVKLLLNKLGDKTRGSAIQLVEALDCIPLAIVQAAAYINRLGPRMSALKYLGELKGVEEQVRLLQKAAVPDLRRDRKTLVSILATWQISFEYIRQKRLSAAYLLSFMSFFNQQGIPEFMVRHYTDKDGEGQDDSSDGRLKEENIDFEEDVAVLRAFSLVDMTQHEDEFEMHSLVQLATRMWLRSTKTERGWQRVFIQVMAQEFPNGDYANWPKCQILFPHVLPMVEQESLTIEETEKWALLLFNAGWYAWRQGLFAQAEGMASKSLIIRREVLDADDLNIHFSSSLLGSILRDLGKYEESESLLRQTLAIREKAGENEHPNTLTTMNNLAGVLDSQGKFDEAESIHRQTLAIRVKVLGKEHPDTLTTMNNLALVLDSQGRYYEAESMYRQTLAMREKVLGKEHPSVLTTMNNLAVVLKRQAKYDEVELMHRQTLATSEKVLGKEHPSTLTVINNLALVLDNQGKHDEAKSMFTQTLAIHEKVLGKEHPDTLTIMNNLALVLGSQGKYSEAESMHRQTLATTEKVLGKEHPDALTTMSNLAAVLSNRGKYAEAELMYRQTLEMRVKVLRKEHPDTLTTMSGLALALDSQGKYHEAEPMLRQTLAMREKVLGKKHPDTLTTMNHLALTLENQAKYDEAKSMYSQTLAMREKVLGEEHPSTLLSVYRLAYFLASQHHYNESVALYERACAGYDATLGENHATSRACRQHYSQVLSSQEQSRVAPEIPSSSASRQISKRSNLSRGLAKIGIRLSKGSG